jgi:hypothetical protein
MRSLWSVVSRSYPRSWGLEITVVVDLESLEVWMEQLASRGSHSSFERMTHDHGRVSEIWGIKRTYRRPICIRRKEILCT